MRLHGRGELLTCMANVSCVPVAVCTSDFAAALDERIFDAEVKGVDQSQAKEQGENYFKNFSNLSRWKTAVRL